MLFFVIFTILYVAIFFIDILPLKKQKKKKEFILVTVFVSLIFILQILDVFGVNLPGPTKGAKKLVSIYKRLVG